MRRYHELTGASHAAVEAYPALEPAKILLMTDEPDEVRALSTRVEEASLRQDVLDLGSCLVLGLPSTRAEEASLRQDGLDLGRAGSR